MPAPALHLGAVVLCSHAGQATPVAPSPRVLLSGRPAVTIASQYVIAGCALAGTGTPPCATGRWIAGAARVLADGMPVASMTGSSTCVPTGTPLVPVNAQPRVLVT